MWLQLRIGIAVVFAAICCSTKHSSNIRIAIVLHLYNTCQTDAGSSRCSISGCQPNDCAARNVAMVARINVADVVAVISMAGRRVAVVVVAAIAIAVVLGVGIAASAVADFTERLR